MLLRSAATRTRTSSSTSSGSSVALVASLSRRTIRTGNATTTTTTTMVTTRRNRTCNFISRSRQEYHHQRRTMEINRRFLSSEASAVVTDTLSSSLEEEDNDVSSDISKRTKDDDEEGRGTNDIDDINNNSNNFNNNSDNIHDIIKQYSRIPQTAASLQMLLRTGRGELLGKSYKTEALTGRMGQQHLATERILIHMASLLRREIPIRLAHRIRDLSRVPLLRDMPSVQSVQQIYVNSFRQLIQVPPINNGREEEQFAALLEKLYTKHSNVLVQMARGAYELRENVKKGKIEGGKVCDVRNDWEFTRMNECHAFLDRFYMSRIGIRVLAGQYLALREPNNNILPPNQHPGGGGGGGGGDETNQTIGLISLKTSPRDVVRQAADDARKMCRKRYGRAPLIELSGRLDLTFPYIPTYLHYMVLELLKNALRATCEYHGNGPLPKIEVIIADDHENEDVAIKIADEGGGIRRSQIHKIWSYLYTTADPAVQQSFLKKHDHDVSVDSSPIAGLGYGLPISRAYCRYFGGAMDLVSMEGYGTDAFLHLKRLGDGEEPLPV